MRSYGEVLVMTNDSAERDTVQSVGGMTQGCAGFAQTVRAALSELDSAVRRYNEQEQAKFRSH